ncbi:hypothetical protein DD237_008224 [Peronospora effusa]|uniref:Uncharacterized protein n=1 Tax=Peronospora effusa TaxID=542832 RepID=A0A425CNJ4_9STRA|nr:hypothetical protein DD237_008224 [Peronospora effusa]
MPWRQRARKKRTRLRRGGRNSDAAECPGSSARGGKGRACVAAAEIQTQQNALAATRAEEKDALAARREKSVRKYPRGGSNFQTQQNALAAARAKEKDALAARREKSVLEDPLSAHTARRQ